MKNWGRGNMIKTYFTNFFGGKRNKKIIIKENKKIIKIVSSTKD